MTATQRVTGITVTDHLPLISRRQVEITLRWLVIFAGTVLNGALIFGTSLLQN